MDFGRVQPQSNRATLQRQVEVRVEDTDDLLDLTGMTIVVEVVPTYDCRAVLSATTDNGKITLIGLGVFEVRFERNEMTNLCPGTYRLGATIGDADITRQLLIDTIAIAGGVVAR